MSDRKFRRVLSRPGSAAVARETVSAAVRQSTLMVRPAIVEPIDYEAFVLKNRTILQNDPQRELLLVPLDDFSARRIPRKLRTTRASPALPQRSPLSGDVNGTSDKMPSSSAPLHVRESIDSFTRDWHVIDFKYDQYSGNWSELPKVPKVHERLLNQVYEVDDTDDDLEDAVNSAVGIAKEGYILKGTEAGTDSFISVATKSFKRRWMSLRQEIDGTCTIEFHKDSKKADSKGTICLDFCHQIIRNSRRGKLAFELRMIEGHKACILAAESDSELEGWLDVLGRAIQNKSETTSRRSIGLSDTSTPPSTPKYGTLRSLELTKNPELTKFSRETDYSIAQLRKENRVNVFAVYPDLQSRRGQFSQLKYQSIIKVEPYKPDFGFRFLFKCLKLDFNLKTTIDGMACLVEPFFTSVSIFHTKLGKLTEEFRFDVNDSVIKEMLNGSKQESINEKSGLDYAENWATYPSAAIFSVHSPSPEMFLVLRIEKILSGNIASATEPYLKPAETNGISKLGGKVHKAAKASCQRMGASYRMPFAWAVRPIFKPNRSLDEINDFGPVYRQDGNRISDEEIVKHLNEIRSTEKPKNVNVIPGRVVTVLKPFGPQCSLSTANVLTSNLLPVEPFPLPPEGAATLEVQEFFSLNPRESFPFTEFVNVLYVFPKALKYDAQKYFPKARNICITVEFRDSDAEDAKPIKAIFGKPGGPSDKELVTSHQCSVLHHNQNPDLYDEVKVLLPSLQLHERHHLLFIFHHVSCSATSKKEVPVETPIGFAWLPLSPNKGRLSLEEQLIAVSSHLPAGYLDYKPLGLGRGFSGPEIRWVDNGKELFRVSFKLVSSIYPEDQSLLSFLYHADRMLDINRSDEDTSSGGSRISVESEGEKGFSKFVQVQHGMPKILKSVMEADISSIVRFFPVLMSHLLKLLVTTTSDDVSMNVVRVIIHMLHSVHEVHKEDIALSFVEFFFNGDNMSQISQRLTLHEELMRSLVSLLKSANTENVVICNLLAHCWFFFQTVIKSMACHLLASGRVKMHRHERFPKDYQDHLFSFVELFLPHVMEKYHELPGETKSANQNLAYFLTRCFSLMDRGFVFKSIKLYLDKMHAAKDSVTLHHFKFEFLALITAYEHHVPVNLPLQPNNGLFGKSDNTNKNVSSNENLITLSDEFCKAHFTVAALLQESKSALSEVHQVRGMALSVLRNLLAKHSFDDRYSSRQQQSRIAALYFPFISVILDNINRIHVQGFNTASLTSIPLSNSGGSAMSKRVSFIDGISLTPSPSSTLDNYGKVSVRRNSSLESAQIKRDSSYLQMISGTLPAGSSLNGLDSQTNLTENLHPHSSDPDISSKSPSPDIEHLSQQNMDSHRATSPLANSHTRSQSLPIRFDKLNSYEVRDILVIFSWITKHVAEETLVSWLQKAEDHVILQFLSLHEMTLHEFKYSGRKEAKGNDKAMTLPARINSDSPINHEKPTSESVFSGLLEANLASEVGLITLDVIGHISTSLKDRLLKSDGDNLLMQKVFSIYLTFLQLGQSETLLKHLFASLRAFISKFPGILFSGSPFYIGKLCFELLRCCGSRLTTVRNEAAALLYLLLRSNFGYTQQQSVTRVHLQVVISVSKLLGDSNLLLNNSRFQESLAIINNYASSDKSMQGSRFPQEVRELTKKVKTVLMATAAMQEHANEPEMILDLQHHLADSYAETSPALRRTWLESMASNHVKDGNLSEAAHTLIHIAALEAEILRKRDGADPEVDPGPGDFLRISTNIARDEGTCGIKSCDEADDDEENFTVDNLIDTLESAAGLFSRAERFEMIPEVYKVMVPLYEKQRNFEALSKLYRSISTTYDKIINVQKSGKRILGRYYKVAFFGKEYFDEESGKEFIYKEPKLTSLAEINQRLRELYGKKFGSENVKMIMSEKEIDESADCDPKYAYIQIIHVHPYNHITDPECRLTDFEKFDNNLNKFMFETPYSLTDPNKSRSATCVEQCKRRTIVTSSYFFPYVVKRIPVISKAVQTLSPIEVAIDEMESRVKELTDVVNCERPDFKRLQLKLQGSISVQVNAGPMAYAKAFLAPKSLDPMGNTFPLIKTALLKQVYKDFLIACENALELNEKIIASDQREYHQALKSNFAELVNELTVYLKEDAFHSNSLSERRDTLVGNQISVNGKTFDEDGGDKVNKRLSCQIEIFDYISGSSTA
ncbi:Dedicator of cytokinesis protein 9 [Halotydeus destructor]|nr:Dedicator of cytokinesis protein 9 [Halotydeus destructor]